MESWTYVLVAALVAAAGVALWLAASRAALAARCAAAEAERDALRRRLEESRHHHHELELELVERKAELEERLRRMEQERAAAFARLSQQMGEIQRANTELRTETGRLARALREPQVRGRYGEIQLRRVAELAGMSRHCDFSLQSSMEDGDGRRLRPDMVVHLPNGRLVAVDAKASIQAYLEALEAEAPELAESCLERFAGHVAAQVADLARKEYWRHLPGAPDFTVLFLPGDPFLEAALARRPRLLEEAAERGVIVATPVTLIALLRAVASLWHEKQVAEEARELLALARQLHRRGAVAFEHARQLGAGLAAAMERYNRFAASVDSRLRPTLERFEEVGARSGKPLPELPRLTGTPRVLEAATADAGSADAPEERT